MGSVQPIQLTIHTGPPAGRVPLGHDADTRQPVAYAARTFQRACNGLISGGTGSGKTTLAAHIADHLRGAWTVRVVDAYDRAAADHALDALFAAERLQSRRHHHDPMHLIVWDGLDQLIRDDRLRFARFVERLTASAFDGPGYGVGHLATVQDPVLLNDDALALRGYLLDNVIALPTRRGSSFHVNSAPVRPDRLPRDHGHALVVVGDQGAEYATHVHLDGGQPIADCSLCRADNREVTR